MTIVSVRMQFSVESKRKQRQLDYIFGGFEAWFPSRLKPIRDRLRGPEAKGVNIVNFWIFESLEWSPRQNEWWRRMNTFEYDFAQNVDTLLVGNPTTNLGRLMKKCSKIAARAPWPQVQALEEPLVLALTRQERSELAVFLDWKRRKPIVLERLFGE